MANKTNIELDKLWVCEHLGDVTDIKTQNSAWVLVQEPGFIGFGVVSADKICWPPYLKKLDWKLVSDLRLFGETGEWHVWRDWDGKHYARLLEFDVEDEKHVWIGCNGENQDDPEESKKKREALTEYHALWGTEVRSGKSAWIKIVEDRGAEIWIPPLKETELKKKNLPLLLKIKQVIDYDSDYHLAGIVDAALVALVDRAKKMLKPSPSLLSETSQAVEEVSCPENTESVNNDSGS